MKKLISILITLLLLCSLCVPAVAYTEYNLVYDVTDLLDAETCSNMGENVLPALSDKHKVQVRVDVVDTLEDNNIEEYAEIFYNNYTYGYSGTNDGVLLMLYITENGNDLVYQDYTLYYGGSNAGTLRQTLDMPLRAVLDSYLNPTAWAGDLAQDNMMFSAALALLSSTTDATLGGDVQQPSGGEVPVDENAVYIYDMAGILTEDELLALNEKARGISEAHQFGVYVVTVENYTDYTDGDEMDAAIALYEAGELGYGADKDGLILLLSMSDRRFNVTGHAYGQTVFNQMAREYVTEQFLPDFKNDDWAGGFEEYLISAEVVLQNAAEGHIMGDGTYDPAEEEAEHLGSGMSLLIGIVVGGIVAFVLKSSMKSVSVAVGATQYEHGVHITNRYEHYTYSTTRYIEHKDDDDDNDFSSSDRGSYSGTSGSF